MKPIDFRGHKVPYRCRFVFWALLGKSGTTAYVERTGKWRYTDLQRLTGQSSCGKKLREMRAACPGLVDAEDIPGSKARGGDKPKHFWISDTAPVASVKPAQRDTLFDMPALGRPE